MGLSTLQTGERCTFHATKLSSTLRASTCLPCDKTQAPSTASKSFKFTDCATKQKLGIYTCSTRQISGSDHSINIVSRTSFVLKLLNCFKNPQNNSHSRIKIKVDYITSYLQGSSFLSPLTPYRPSHTESTTCTDIPFCTLPTKSFQTEAPHLHVFHAKLLKLRPQRQHRHSNQLHVKTSQHSSMYKNDNARFEITRLINRNAHQECPPRHFFTKAFSSEDVFST